MKLVAMILLLIAASAASATEPLVVRVRLETSEGNITLALDAKRAPRTVANFMAYVDDGRLDGTTFYRASRSKRAPGLGFIQGGIDLDARRRLPAVLMEPTNQTGLTHVDGAISMARNMHPDSATGNFSLFLGPAPWLNASEGRPGYAVFGRIMGGRDTIARILAKPTGGGSGPMRGQMLFKPVTIHRAIRLNGTARPTGMAKSWLIKWGKPAGADNDIRR
jgi:peptidyl-prolyl cis-trans isomerase A (cyclophilin A)